MILQIGTKTKKDNYCVKELFVKESLFDIERCEIPLSAISSILF